MATLTWENSLRYFLPSDIEEDEYNVIEAFIQSLLAEQKKEFLMSENSEWHKDELRKEIRKDLLTELLNEAPEDKELLPDYLYLGKFKEPADEGFNESNNQWRTLLESKLK